MCLLQWLFKKKRRIELNLKMNGSRLRENNDLIRLLKEFNSRQLTHVSFIHTCRLLYIINKQRKRIRERKIINLIHRPELYSTFKASVPRSFIHTYILFTHARTHTHTHTHKPTLYRKHIYSYIRVNIFTHKSVTYEVDRQS